LSTSIPFPLPPVMIKHFSLFHICFPISHFICTLYCPFSHIVAVAAVKHWVFPKHEGNWLLLIGPCRCLLN
jgi:hypothetical protein